MATVKSTAQWEAESDAQTLLSAEAIRRDAARMKRAKPPLAKLVKESQVKAQAGARLLKKKPMSGPKRSK